MIDTSIIILVQEILCIFMILTVSFIFIDLFGSVFIMAMGMTMVPYIIISLPLKIILFVAACVYKILAY